MSAAVPRPDGRALDALRPVFLTRGVNPYAEGSCLIRMGETRVICTASVDERVPRWLMKQGRGWVTAEYAMLPRATSERTPREQRGPSGRSSEIRRLIGRALRSVVDLELLGERMITLDCDVLLADAGTRCASITGAYVALVEALAWMRERKLIRRLPLYDQVAAVSVGLFAGRPRLDLCYEEDSAAGVDMNVVMTGDGKLVEVQGTAEGEPFSRQEMDAMVDLASEGIQQLFEKQREVLGDLLAFDRQR